MEDAIDVPIGYYYVQYNAKRVYDLTGDADLWAAMCDYYGQGFIEQKPVKALDAAAYDAYVKHFPSVEGDTVFKSLRGADVYVQSSYQKVKELQSEHVQNSVKLGQIAEKIHSFTANAKMYEAEAEKLAEEIRQKGKPPYNSPDILALAQLMNSKRDMAKAAIAGATDLESNFRKLDNATLKLGLQIQELELAIQLGDYQERVSETVRQVNALGATYDKSELNAAKAKLEGQAEVLELATAGGAAEQELSDMMLSNQVKELCEGA